MGWGEEGETVWEESGGGSIWEGERGGEESKGV